jgi:hypothetical protein
VIETGAPEVVVDTTGLGAGVEYDPRLASGSAFRRGDCAPKVAGARGTTSPTNTTTACRAKDAERTKLAIN